MYVSRYLLNHFHFFLRICCFSRFGQWIVYQFSSPTNLIGESWKWWQFHSFQRWSRDSRDHRLRTHTNWYFRGANSSSHGSAAYENYDRHRRGVCIYLYNTSKILTPKVSRPLAPNHYLGFINCHQKRWTIFYESYIFILYLHTLAYVQLCK